MIQEERDPFDYYKDEKDPEKLEQSTSDDIVTNLRSDMLAASEVEPAQKNIFQLINLKLLIGIFIGLIILGLILYSLIGPGRSFLEEKLVSLKRMEATSAQQIPSLTRVPDTSTPTSVSSCRDALTITLADVGQALCVQGTVIETITNPTNFMVIFSAEKGSFYWLSYDLVWSQAELDTCYQTTGTIDQIANSPVLVFGYNNLPKPCP
jgi:hypothetical protein